MGTKEINQVLTVNAGSSSIKIVSFDGTDRTVEITITNIGSPNSKIKVAGQNQQNEVKQIAASNHKDALSLILTDLDN